ncbi:MAG: glycoside hydrolase family 57 protein [Candidatus Sericytochromatia bacterium]
MSPTLASPPPLGYHAMVLHAHLPYVRHPEYDYFLEEHWLYEAITETYVPLLVMFDSLLRDGVDFRLTMTMTPSLVSMLADPLLQERYLIYIGRLVELAEKEVIRTEGDRDFHPLALYYAERFRATYTLFNDTYQRNLVTGFKRFQDAGVLEIVTCCATHGFLPLFQQYPEAVQAQIEVAAQSYRQHFGRNPRGIWLAECGYYPGADRFLEQAGIEFFFTDTHGVVNATPRPRYGAYAPIFCPDTGVAAFSRDRESSEQVWSSVSGYPGDHYFREYYRDIGYDLDFEYIKDYVQPDGTRKNTGIKYHRITGKTDKKQPYNLEMARQRADRHASHFVRTRAEQITHLSQLFEGHAPLVVSPYDAELYGHWWFEGPEWLNLVIRKAAHNQSVYRMTTPYEYLLENPRQQAAQPSPSSWGANGYNSFWLNETNDKIYRHLHKATERMIAMAYRFSNPYPLQEKALNQAARELLLAQSSDWPFIMKTGTMVEYAVKRVKTHLHRFNELHQAIHNDQIDAEWLDKVEYLDNIFPEIDYRVYTLKQA